MQFTPALRYDWLTPFYDPVVALTSRERGFKRRLLEPAIGITEAFNQPSERGDEDPYAAARARVRRWNVYQRTQIPKFHQSDGAEIGDTVARRASGRKAHAIDLTRGSCTHQ